MKLAELKSGQGKVDIDLEVKSKGEVRSFNKYGRDLKVANANVSDGESEIKFTLWNDDIDKINVGDKFKLVNGYVSEFNGERQLSTGKFGKIEVAGKESAADAEPNAEPKAKKVKKSDIPETEF
ncbi:MAG: SOSS complex subunit B family protein [archaeon]